MSRTPWNWRCRDRVLSLGDGPTRIMGILNVTPDSFSDGGQFRAPEEVVAAGLRMVEDGACILDVGGESTRPGAEPVSCKQELERVIPVIGQLRAASQEVILSIDTTKAVVARTAMEAGADIINDISALTFDPEMVQVAAETRAGLVLMHMQGAPRTMQDNPVYEDVVEEVSAWLRRQTRMALDAGVTADAICWDPGIGFGKTLEHNLALIHATGKLAAEAPLLVGVSRKRWIGAITGRRVEDRLAGSLAGAAAVIDRGGHILRVHDVKESCDLARVLDMISRNADG